MHRSSDSDDIRRLLELERVMVDRTIKSQTVSLNPNQILTKELSPDMKQWEELIEQMLQTRSTSRSSSQLSYSHVCIVLFPENNITLAIFFVKRIQCARYTPTANLPYGMFLIRLYRHVMETYPHLDNGIYDIVDRVMRPLALKQTRRPRSDRGKARHSVMMMMIMSKLLVQVLHLLPPTLTLLILSTTKTTKCLPLPNKPMKLSLNDKPSCSTKRKKYIRRCAEVSNHLEKH
ncbi:hypothetical protein Tco_1532928 [Tanacetum coccineum]